MWFNQYPYINVNDLNLDFILKTLRDLKYEVENFVSLNAIKYANPIQWDITRQYERNTVVVDPITGTAYLSVAPVPSGVALNRTEYWTPIFDLDIAQANNNITLRDDANNVLSTFTSVVGDWLLWNGKLYRVILDIGMSQAYVEGYNVERYTVELFIKDYITAIEDAIGNLDDLTTADATSIVNAINSLVTTIGVLDNLETTDKTDIVSAINELHSNIVSASTTLDELKNIRFYLHDYDTFDDLVNAVNDVSSACVIIDSNMTIDNAVTFSTPVHILGDANNHVLRLQNDILITCDHFKMENVTIDVDGGSIVLGDDSRSIIYYNIINNTFHDYNPSVLKYAIKVNRAVNGNISGNMFYSDNSGDRGMYCIYHDQTTSAKWFQNTEITNNTFRSVYSMLFVDGRVNPEQCAGIDFSDNDSIWITKGVHLDSADHFRFDNNIIDYDDEPFYLICPNGAKITNNYIYSGAKGASCINMILDGFCEAVVISNNYFWNMTQYSGVNVTYGIRIVTNETTRTNHGFIINNNFFRNFRYCIYAAFNAHGMHIYDNSFYEASYSVYYDNTNYSQVQSYAYSNFLESNVGTPVQGVPVSIMMAENTYALTVPAGSDTAEFTPVGGSGFDSLTLMLPNGSLSGTVYYREDTGKAVVKLSAAVSANTGVKVKELYRLTRYA